MASRRYFLVKGAPVMVALSEHQSQVVSAHVSVMDFSAPRIFPAVLEFFMYKNTHYTLLTFSAEVLHGISTVEEIFVEAGSHLAV